MLARFKEFAEKAYQLVKALKEANLTKSDIDNLREQVEKLENVPKSILDQQVFELKISPKKCVTLERNPISVAAFLNCFRK